MTLTLSPVRMKSAEQAVEITRGQRKPSRVFEVEAQVVKAIRERTGLSQVNFATLINIPVATLRNWEQGRRHPKGPAAALLTAISNDPEHVVAALNA